MDDTLKEKRRSFQGRVGTLLCIWSLTGMPLTMILSIIYTFLGVSLPSIFFLLSAIIYLAGGLLAVLWSKERLYRDCTIRSGADVLMAIFMLFVGVVFLLLSIIFCVKGFLR